jgi:hypothetical protein
LNTPLVAFTTSSWTSVCDPLPWRMVVTSAFGPVSASADVPSPNHGSITKLNLSSLVSVL